MKVWVSDLKWNSGNPRNGLGPIQIRITKDRFYKLWKSGLISSWPDLKIIRLLNQIVQVIFRFEKSTRTEPIIFSSLVGSIHFLFQVENLNSNPKISGRSIGLGQLLSALDGSMNLRDTYFFFLFTKTYYIMYDYNPFHLYFVICTTTTYGWGYLYSVLTTIQYSKALQRRPWLGKWSCQLQTANFM